MHLSNSCWALCCARPLFFCTCNGAKNACIAGMTYVYIIHKQNVESAHVKRLQTDASQLKWNQWFTWTYLNETKAAQCYWYIDLQEPMKCYESVEFCNDKSFITIHEGVCAKIEKSPPRGINFIEFSLFSDIPHAQNHFFFFNLSMISLQLWISIACKDSLRREGEFGHIFW